MAKRAARRREAARQWATQEYKTAEGGKQDTNPVRRFRRAMPVHFPVRLLDLADRLPPGFQERFKKLLFRIVKHLEGKGYRTRAAKEIVIRLWASDQRQTPWPFFAEVPPELLDDARDLASMLVAIDIGNEHGEKALLAALGGRGNPAFKYLRADIERREKAPKGGVERAKRYEQYVPEWQEEFDRLKDKGGLTDERIFNLIAANHAKIHKGDPDDVEPPPVKKINGKTIRRRLLGSR
jgi:hypothetical protein